MKPILKITFFSVFFLYIGVYFGRADLKQKIEKRAKQLYEQKSYYFVEIEDGYHQYEINYSDQEVKYIITGERKHYELR
jgi:non-canonical (house-cleaning) NTP pyrophosphatase